MKKSNKFLYIFMGFIVLAGLWFILYSFNNSEEKVSDAVRFKNDYEALNGTKRSDGSLYNSISISEDNPIKYISVKESLEILEEDKAIIYVGAPWCPWCRGIIPALLKVCKDKKIETLYYLNLDDDKSVYEIKDNKAVKKKDGSKEYYKLLDKLSSELSDYTLTENGEKYTTGEKRIYNPTVFAIKDGKVVSSHEGSVKLNSNQTSTSVLTKEQNEELYKIYEKMINSVYNDNSVCGIGESCD